MPDATDADWQHHTDQRDELFTELLCLEAEIEGLRTLRAKKIVEIEEHKDEWIAEYGQSSSLARPLWSVIDDSELGL